MASKFADFIEKNKLDSRRIMASSNHLERLRPADRVIKLAARNKSDDAKPGDDDKKEAPAKPRSGRPITPRLLSQASAGDKISGPAKTRLLRAVNRILEQKKQDAVDIRALF